MAAFLTLWLAGLAAASWVAWAILGSPPAVAGWFVLMCVVIAVGVFATAAFWPDRGMELPSDPDPRLVARVLPPPGTGGRLFLRVRRDGGDTSVSLVYLALRPSPPSEERFEWSTVADQRFGRGEELLAEDCVAAWSEMAHRRHLGPAPACPALRWSPPRRSARGSCYRARTCWP